MWLKGHTHFLPKVEVKDYNVMIDGQNIFDQVVKHDLIPYDQGGGQGGDYTTSFLLDYIYFKKYYKMIVDLSKALDANQKVSVRLL